MPESPHCFASWILLSCRYTKTLVKRCRRGLKKRGKKKKPQINKTVFSDVLPDGWHFLPVTQTPRVEPVVGRTNPWNLRREADGSSQVLQAGYDRCGLFLQKHIKVGVDCTGAALPPAPAGTLTLRRFSATLSDFERTSRHDFLRAALSQRL